MHEKSIPREFSDRWRRFYGEKPTRNILEILEHSDPRIIAPNLLYTTKPELKQSLEKQGFRFKSQSQLGCLILDFEPFSIVASKEYLSGQFTIQSLTSIIPPKSLNPLSDSLVADMTASPGIKTCLLASSMKNTGTIFAIEKSKKRIPALKSNLARMGVYNTIILNGDARSFPKLDIKVDHVLLDAPCSGTGLKLSKNKRLEPRLIKDIKRHSQVQKELLDKAWSQLRVNGTLVYSTCSLEPEEGEVQINEFLTRHDGEVRVLPIKINIGVPGSNTQWDTVYHSQISKTKRIFPSQGMDGFFVTLMEKVTA